MNSIFKKINRLITWLWWHLPFKRQQKENLKTRIFLLLPFVFRKTRVYENWLYTKKHDPDDYEVPILPGNESDSVIQSEKSSFDGTPMYYSEVEPVRSLAIIAHVHYPELLPELLSYLSKWENLDYKFFITTQKDCEDAIKEALSESEIEHEIFTFDNHGRDVLPFIKILPSVFDQGYNFILKIHTKKSDHRQTGYLWRKDIYKKLLSFQAAHQIRKIFETDNHVGMLGPVGHIVPMSLYYGANARKLQILCKRINLDFEVIHSISFVAGSMFYARREALLPLLSLKLGADDFELENGQQDGTMAHAIERFFAISAHAAGFKIVDNTYSFEKPEPLIVKDHPFTW